MDYREKSKEVEDSAIQDILFRFDHSMSEEKKLRQYNKTQSLVGETLELESQYEMTNESYNEFLEIFKTKIVQ